MQSEPLDQQIDDTIYTEMKIHIVAYSLLILLTGFSTFFFLKDAFKNKYNFSYWRQKKTIQSLISFGSMVVAVLLLVNTIIHWKNLQRIKSKIKTLTLLTKI